jgi:hypothetical protein
MTNDRKTLIVCLGFAITMLFFVLTSSRCKGAEVKLLWNPNPVTDVVTEYRIYRGIDLIAKTSDTSVIVDLPADQRSTLSLRAVNSKGESDPANLTLVPFTPRFSTNLRDWTAKPTKVIFVKAESTLFANYSYPLQ